jgi:two-component system sensor histidine kinase DegS
MGIGYLRKYREQVPGLRNSHLWIIIVLFIFLTISHFAQSLPNIPGLQDISIPAALELSRHSLERLLYLLLILYAGWTLGIIGSAAVWLSSAGAMLVRTFLISPDLRDALLESLAVVVIGALAITLMVAYRQNKRQREKLRDTIHDMKLVRRNYEELFTNASDAIWIHDLDGNITLANTACEKLTSYSLSELIGMNIREFLNPEALTLARQVKDRLLRGEAMEQRYEQRLIKKDGSEAIMQLATRVIFSDGKPRSFQNMARDVTEERKLRDNLHFYLSQVLQAQEEERKRLARELHDDTSQQILLLTHGIDNITSQSGNSLSGELRTELDQLYELSKQTYQGIKRYAQALRPGILDDLGLVPAVKWLAQEVNNLTGIEVQVRIDVIPSLAPETQLVLFRIVQEALNNVQRHSGASEASITVDYQETEIRVTIKDNGKGFSPPQQLSDFAGQGKLGLTGMAERIRLVGGEIEVSSQIGKGTRIIVKAPTQLYDQCNI